MIVLVDVVVDDRNPPDERPEVGTVAMVELRDTSEADAAAITLAQRAADVTGSASRWLTTVELVADQQVDSRADLTVWVRISGSPDHPLAPGDWITMQVVPVDPTIDEQRVEAPVRRVG